MTTSATIRPMEAGDVDAMALLEKTVFTDPWPKSAFREFLGIESRINLVAVGPEGDIVGYVLAQTVVDELQIQNIAVDPQSRRRQLGALLLRRAEAEGIARGALCAVLDVRANNEAARGLYHSFGYRMIGRRKSYYRHPVDDALVLFRRLDRAPSNEVAQEPKDGMVS